MEIMLISGARQMGQLYLHRILKIQGVEMPRNFRTSPRTEVAVGLACLNFVRRSGLRKNKR